jgi:hypothetical protein
VRYYYQQEETTWDTDILDAGNVIEINLTEAGCWECESCFTLAEYCIMAESNLGL